MDKNNAMSFEFGSDQGIILPNRFFIVMILLTLFVVIVLSTGWNNIILFYAAILIIFFIFFDIVPYKEQFSVGNQQLFDKKDKIKLNCEQYKNNALNNINNYLQCKNMAKPKVVCPKEFITTNEITEYAKAHGDLIQNNEHLHHNQPENTNRVCGLVPGHASRNVKPIIDKLMTDNQLTQAMKNEILLHQIKEDLENKLIADPLDLDIQEKLNLVEHEIVKLKPEIIYNLRAKKKTVGFVRNALK